jgi:putative spermidine/putrescine transport system ATP-binding protein
VETESSFEVRDPARPCAVRFDGVTKKYGAVTAVDNVDLEVEHGEFFSLLGPSGSGKTTCLRLIAGFETPTTGRILLQGDDVTRRAPFQRDVNTVFQDYALFPHMSVDENVAYGMVVKRVPKTERRERVEEALRLVRLVGLGKRRPSELSGGQRQRVALARALVNRPQVLLLDEPLGALDLKLRQEMQVELKALQREVGITFMFVTHDQEEALTMSDRIAVFNNGRIEQIGTPGDIYEQPETAFVAGFVGTSNLLPADRAAALLGVNAPVTLRPEKIRIVAPGTPVEPGDFGADGRVRDVVYLGALTRYLVELDDGVDLAVLEQNLQKDASAVLAVKGQAVRLVWPTEATRVVSMGQQSDTIDQRANPPVTEGDTNA